MDFDGTLHPNWTLHQRGDRQVAVPYSGPWFVEAPILASIIEPYSGRIDIVIASWWAYTRPISEIAKLLPQGIASRIIGSIWLPEQLPRYRDESMSRYRSIQLWLDHHSVVLTDDWIALDDDDRGWPSELCHHLVHAQGTLSSAEVQATLIRCLSERLGSPDH
ncbi:HAD domain-containing protein [Stenotrophomonas sp. SY1]|uniref:HAD domain-containing protein n=1 Tax=Stenotrophomonas sp. SY1 TaxID=477235 RepID=UPI001E319451|nr:HAD domain-containing protein [Stenotrophomonas sp. SY1]MCD9087708.1 hypothetical protein [Stenotrophomonas sp. SY1]